MLWWMEWAEEIVFIFIPFNSGANMQKKGESGFSYHTCYHCKLNSAERFWTLNESLGKILWPSFLLKIRPGDCRKYLTQEFSCYVRSMSSLRYPSHPPGTTDPFSSKSWHWAVRFIFRYPPNSAWKSDYNSQKIQQPKVDLNAWPWLSYSSNSGSQSMAKHDHLRPPLKASKT